MKLYLVKRTDRVDYDEYDSFVVRAEDEESAYKVCDYYHCDKKHATVTEVNTSGEAMIILGSFNAG